MNDICVICTDELNGEILILCKLKCRHMYHFDCLKDCQKANIIVCPLCRSHLDEVKPEFPKFCHNCDKKINNDQIRRLHPCKHLVHKDCFADWIEMQTCPICSEKIQLCHDYIQYGIYSDTL